MSIMNSVEEYARRRTKLEGEELDCLNASKVFENYQNPVFNFC
jgi:hypothetical protein